MAEPMSDEQIAEVQALLDELAVLADADGDHLAEQVGLAEEIVSRAPALLAEVKRLRSELVEARRDYWAWRKRSELVEAELDRQRRRADAAGDARRRAEREHARMVGQIEQSRTWAAEIVERAEKAEADAKALTAEVDRLTETIRRIGMIRTWQTETGDAFIYVAALLDVLHDDGRALHADLEAHVHAAFDAADEQGVSLDAMTVAELTEFVMAAIRGEGGRS